MRISAMFGALFLIICPYARNKARLSWAYALPRCFYLLNVDINIYVINGLHMRLIYAETDIYSYAVYSRCRLYAVLYADMYGDIYPYIDIC